MGNHVSMVESRLVEFAGVGHAPTLLADDQVAAVATFLLG